MQPPFLPFTLNPPFLHIVANLSFIANNNLNFIAKLQIDTPE